MEAGTTFSRITKGAAGAIVLELLDDSKLGESVRSTGKLSISRIRKSFSRALTKACDNENSPIVDSIRLRQRLLKGLPVEAVFIASAIAFDTLRESEDFFGLSASTARERIGRTLDASESDKALRLIRAVSLAACVLGGLDEARAYLKTPLFALGGITPRELLVSADGEQLVINELQTHMDGGPV